MADAEATELSQDELFEHYSFVASKGQDPLRVDKFLMNFIENATRNKIQSAAKEGHIWVNESVVKQNYEYTDHIFATSKLSVQKESCWRLAASYRYR